MRTLLVVGDPATRQWLCTALAGRRCEAVAVDDPEAALAALMSERFPVVVVSVDSSGDDLAGFCQRLRAVALPSECLLLAVGRQRHPAGLPEWFAAGVDDYLVACRDTPRLAERLAAAERRADLPVAAPAAGSAAAWRPADDQIQVLFDRSPDAILFADIETRQFLRVNPAACRMLGYSEEELLRMGVDSIHPPEDLPLHRVVFEEGVQGRRTEGSDFRCLHKDGSIVDVDIAATRLSYRGRPCLVGIFRNVTERKRAAEALRIQRDLGVALSTITDLPAALDAVLQAVCRIPGVDCGGIYLIDDRRELILTAHAGLSPEFVAAVRHYARDSLEAQLVEEGRTIHIDGRQIAAGSQDARLAEGLRGLAIVSIKHDGRAIALLNAASRTRDEIPLSSRYALEALASRLGGVIARLTTRAELAVSRDNFQSLFDAIDDFLFILDEEGRILHVNPVVERRLGYAAAELCGLPAVEVHPPERRQQAAEILRALLAGEGALCPIPLMARDGTLVPVETKITRGRWNGRPALFGVARDIAQRLLMERQLREHDERLSTLFANLPDVVLTVAPEATVQLLNRDGPGMEKVEGTSALSFLAPESRTAAQEALARAIATRQVQSVEALDVYGVWWACRLVPMVEGDGVGSVMVICTDVTEQRRAAEAVQKEQRLLRQLIDLHERDRQVIAYEIHDGLAQQLTAALYGFQTFERLREEMPEKAAESFAGGMKLLGSSVDETRRLIGGLRPPILDEFGIVAAIEYLIHDCHTRGGPKVEFDYDVSFDRLAPPLESALFRIVQEALTNACRHSQSAKARVGLSEAGGRIHLDVRDWGVGFDAAHTQEGRFGLQGIRERVRLLGGRVVITTSPGQGTHLVVELPLIESAATDPR